MTEDGSPTRRTFLQATGGLLGVTASGFVSGATIDPTLRGSSGQTDVVVRLGSAIRPDAAGTHRREQVIERLKAHADEQQSAVERALAARPGVEVSRRFWLANALAVTVDVDATPLEALGELDAVEYIHGTSLGDSSAGIARGQARDTTDARATAATPPADVFDERETSWVLELLNVPEVWDRYDTRGEGARVAVVDTGVDPDHPDVDLDGWTEFDERGQRVDSEPSDPGQGVGHGTWMASLATGGDASGMDIGVAPDAELYVASMGAEYNFPAVMAGLEWAVENDADAVVMSVTMEGRWGETTEPMANAVAAGTLPITAVEWPVPFLFNATTPDALVTAPVTRDLVPRNGANGGRIRWERALRGFDLPADWPGESFVPDVSLPGTEVPSGVSGPQFPDQNWVEKGRGASATPPFTAGIVALLQSAADERLSPAQLRETFRDTAFQPDRADAAVPNTRVGYGIPDAASAVARHVDSDRTVSGVVTDPEGSPVEGATVVATSGAETTTAGDGTYALSVPDGQETLTASAVGYEPTETAVAAGESTADLAFETPVVPDIERIEREATRLAPGETLTLEFAVEHVDGARVTLESEGRRVAPADFDVSIDGQSTAVGRETGVDRDTSTVRVELTAHDDARGVTTFTVGVANLDGEEPATTELPLDAVHVHERPLTVAADEDIQSALDAAAPETRVELAGEEWTVETGSFEPTFGDSLLEYRPTSAVLDPAQDDEAALVIDESLTLAAADGHDPTILVDGTDSADRAVGVRIGAPYVTLEDVTIDAGGTLAGISLLNAVGGTVENVTVENARHGLLGELTMSLLARSNDFRASEAGIRLEWVAWNARLADNDIRNTTEGIVLDSGFLISKTTLSGNRFDGVSTEVATEGDGKLSYDRNDGESTETDGTPEDGQTPADPATATPGADRTAEGDGTETTVTSDDESPGDAGPGFGIPASLGSIAGLGYLLRRRAHRHKADE